MYEDKEKDLLKLSFKAFKVNKYSFEDFSKEYQSWSCKEISIDENPHLKQRITIYEVPQIMSQSDDSVGASKSHLIDHNYKSSGFYYVPNPFSDPLYLFQLLKDAITTWPGKENKVNLDIDSSKPEDVWKTSLHQIASENLPLSRTWLYKLRWTSLGFHYHWSEQAYHLSDRTEMPSKLQQLAQSLAKNILGWESYIPEAGIVNYYHLNHSMCFHVDHAEPAKEVPLISLSLGQPGIYLLGGLTRDVSPIPLVLRHGDVVFMTKASRQAYHAVPRLLPLSKEVLSDQMLFSDETDASSESRDSLCPWCLETATKECHDGIPLCGNTSCSTLWEYINCSRVNINVRQVLLYGDGDTPQLPCMHPA